MLIYFAVNKVLLTKFYLIFSSNLVYRVLTSIWLFETSIQLYKNCLSNINKFQLQFGYKKFQFGNKIYEWISKGISKKPSKKL